MEYSFGSLCQNMKKCPLNQTQARVYASVFSALFFNAFVMTMLFPFLPFMIQFLLPDVEEAAIGKYAGILAAAMFIGRVFGSYAWGALADRKGRKTVLIVSNVLIGIFSVAFGFSVNFPMAVGLRFAAGLCNAILGTSKAVISEVSDDGTQALGLSISVTSFGVGLIIGPSVSGAIADPIRQYSLNISSPILHSFLVRFPYSLPCLVSGLISIATTVILLLCLPETLGMKKKQQSSSPQAVKEEDEGDEDGEGEGGRGGEGDYEREGEGEGEGAGEDGRVSQRLKDETSISEVQEVDLGALRWRPFAGDSVSGDCVSSDGDGVIGDGEGVNLTMEEGEMERGGKLRKLVRNARRTTKMVLSDFKFLLMDRVVVLAILSYCSYSFAVIGFDEVFPIWAATSPRLGGLGFTLHEIGIAMAIIGAALLPFSMFLYAGLERYFKSTGSFYLSTLPAMMAMVIIPNLHLLVEHTIPMWILLLLLQLVVQVSANVGFAATSLFVNNSVTFDRLGTVNGLSMTFVALFRAISPLFAGGIFAVSLTTMVGFPFDYHLVFTLLGVVYVISVVIVAFLPESINRQKQNES